MARTHRADDSAGCSLPCRKPYADPDRYDRKPFSPVHAGRGRVPDLRADASPSDDGRPGGSAADRLTGARPEIRARLREHGAVLLRGFGDDGVDGFERTVRAIGGEPLTYAERSSPRSTIKGQVYTSTDYPPSEEIFLHNENSYQATWPLTLFFLCVTPPDTLGSTPLADTRRVLDAIDPQVREEFAARGWMVVRNFTDGFGVPWQHAFNTEDRAEVEAYCARNGVVPEWTPGACGPGRAARRCTGIR